MTNDPDFGSDRICKTDIPGTAQEFLADCTFAVIYECPKNHPWTGWNWSASYPDLKQAEHELNWCKEVNRGWPVEVFDGSVTDAQAECERRNTVAKALKLRSRHGNDLTTVDRKLIRELAICTTPGSNATRRRRGKLVQWYGPSTIILTMRNRNATVDVEGVST